MTAAHADLLARLLDCRTCPELVADRRSVVVGAGPVPAPVLVVGEAPGAVEDERGTPFVGRAGRLLDRLLEEAGLPRGGLHVTNIVKCRPPGNRTPTRSEIGNCRPWLDRELALVDPRLVIALGSTATRWALGTSGRLADVRGRPHDALGRVVLATYHPSAAIRFGPAGRPMAALRADLALAADVLSEIGR